MLSPKTIARQALAAAFLGLFLDAAAAAPQQYVVEVIVFENLTGNAAAAELWSRTNQEPLPEADAALGLDAEPAAPAKLDHTPLRADGLRLGDLRAALEASGRYKILAHRGWRQPGLAREQAAPVELDVPLGAAPAEASPGQTPMAGDAPGQYLIPPVVVAPQPRLEGELRLILSRYLHLETDLRYFTGELQQPLDAVQEEFADMALQPVVYRLKQSRRMRSGELHYFDHPAFGLVALVTPAAAGQ